MWRVPGMTTRSKTGRMVVLNALRARVEGLDLTAERSFLQAKLEESPNESHDPVCGSSGWEVTAAEFSTGR